MVFSCRNVRGKPKWASMWVFLASAYHGPLIEASHVAMVNSDGEGKYATLMLGSESSLNKIQTKWLHTVFS